MSIERNDIEIHCMKFEKRKWIHTVATANDAIRYAIALQLTYHL